MLAPVKLPSLQVDDLHFHVRRSARRRTMQITVERDGELVLSAPPEVDEAALRAFVLEKRFWIYTKLAEKDRLQRRVPRKEFVGGEGFLYLGRSHRLQLVDEQDVPLKLAAGRFCLRRDAIPDGREHFIRWYSERAKAWLSSRLVDYQSRMEVLPVGVKVQDLGDRWGFVRQRANGCTSTGRRSCCRHASPSTWWYMRSPTCTNLTIPQRSGSA